MIYGACLRNGAVTAVMIGEDKSFVAYDLTGASAAEYNDGIFYGSLVDAVQLFFGEFKPFFYHVGIYLLAKQHGQPHAFIGKGFKTAQA
jgi:hypothetical protein